MIRCANNAIQINAMHERHPRELAMKSTTDRKKELSDFLRHKRASITPDEVGLPLGPNRRTHGLRREEVAVLANVSLTWYTWVEQGKEVQASASVLSSISKALKLNEAETRYIFELAGHKYTNHSNISDTKLDQLKDLLYSMENRPAYCVDRYWTVRAVNPLASEIFSVQVGTNCIEDFFTNPDSKQRYPSFELTAAMLVAQFRHQAAIFYDDSKFQDIATKLVKVSSDFKALWENHSVDTQPYLDLIYNHPSHGHMYFIPCVLTPYNNAELRIFYYIPRNEISGT